MPKDSNLPDQIKSGKDLLPGDIIREKKGQNDISIIIDINCLDSKDYLLFYDIIVEAHYYSPTHNKYNVICGRNEILKYYDLAELQLLRKSADLLEDRKKLVNNRKKRIDRLNNNLRKEKK